jgi:hypothetical protein
MTAFRPAATLDFRYRGPWRRDSCSEQGAPARCLRRAREAGLRTQSPLTAAVGVVAGAFNSPSLSSRTLSNQSQFGELSTFTGDETKQSTTVRDMVARYVAQPSPPHPLCLSVFGPPESGKSFAVKQICLEAKKVVSKNLKLPSGPSPPSMRQRTSET